MGLGYLSSTCLCTRHTLCLLICSRPKHKQSSNKGRVLVIDGQRSLYSSFHHRRRRYDRSSYWPVLWSSPCGRASPCSPSRKRNPFRRPRPGVPERSREPVAVWRCLDLILVLALTVLVSRVSFGVRVSVVVLAGRRKPHTPAVSDASPDAKGDVHAVVLCEPVIVLLQDDVQQEKVWGNHDAAALPSRVFSSLSSSSYGTFRVASIPPKGI